MPDGAGQLLRGLAHGNGTLLVSFEDINALSCPNKDPNQHLFPANNLLPYTRSQLNHPRQPPFHVCGTKRKLKLWIELDTGKKNPWEMLHIGPRLDIPFYLSLPPNSNPPFARDAGRASTGPKISKDIFNRFTSRVGSSVPTRVARSVAAEWTNLRDI